MILPCRIHRASNRVDPLPLTFLLIGFLLATQPSPMSAQTAASTFEQPGVTRLPPIPIQITAGIDAGYDDNATLGSSNDGSLFSRENVVLTYNRPGERTQLFWVGVGFFTRNRNGTGQNETRENFRLVFNHTSSSRLSFSASLYGAYQNEP